MEQIVADNINKYYGMPSENSRGSYERLKVLSEISFRVEKNDFVSILGPSGCGKSTLLRLLAGLDSDYEGSVNVDGTDLREKGFLYAICFRRIISCPGEPLWRMCCYLPRLRVPILKGS